MPSNHCSNWEYHAWVREKNKGKRAHRELCVMCGGETPWPKALDIKHRSYYVEGCGQLCKGCWDLTGGNSVPHPD